MIEHTRWTLRTTLSAEEVHRALVDFGPDRARIWKETSDPAVFKVHAVGQTWAEATEGVAHSWSRERYDWSQPGTVTLDQQDSNVAVPEGRIVYTVEPTGTGCVITCDRRRRFRRTPRGLMAGTFMRLFGPAILRRQFETALGRLSASRG